MSAKTMFNTCHTAICTESEEHLILVDKRDMHIFELNKAKSQPPPTPGYLLPEAVTHTNMNIQGLQLI